MLGDAPEHLGADLHILVKCPSVSFGLVRMNQLNVGGALTAARLGSPAKAEQRSINFSCFRVGPVAQRARARETLNSRVGDVLVRSTRSARTRKARARTERTASCLVLP
jgi:hypothetical protein